MVCFDNGITFTCRSIHNKKLHEIAKDKSSSAVYMCGLTTKNEKIATVVPSSQANVVKSHLSKVISQHIFSVGNTSVGLLPVLYDSQEIPNFIIRCALATERSPNPRFLIKENDKNIVSKTLTQNVKSTKSINSFFQKCQTTSPPKAAIVKNNNSTKMTVTQNSKITSSEKENVLVTSTKKSTQNTFKSTKLKSGKRKRIVESDSSEENNSEEERDCLLSKEPEHLDNNVSDEDIIPPTPEPKTVTKIIRKDKIFMGDDDFIHTIKNVTQTIKIIEEPKNDNLLKHCKKQKIIPTKNKNKVSPPKISKQSNIMNFFKKG